MILQGLGVFQKERGLCTVNFVGLSSDSARAGSFPKGTWVVHSQHTVNIQSTYSQHTVNTQSTHSQHTVNITRFSAENLKFLYINGHGAALTNSFN